MYSDRPLQNVDTSYCRQQISRLLILLKLLITYLLINYVLTYLVTYLLLI